MQQLTFITLRIAVPDKIFLSCDNGRLACPSAADLKAVYYSFASFGSSQVGLQSLAACIGYILRKDKLYCHRGCWHSLQHGEVACTIALHHDILPTWYRPLTPQHRVRVASAS